MSCLLKMHVHAFRRHRHLLSPLAMLPKMQWMARRAQFCVATHTHTFIYGRPTTGAARLTAVMRRQCVHAATSCSTGATRSLRTSRTPTRPSSPTWRPTATRAGSCPPHVCSYRSDPFAKHHTRTVLSRNASIAFTANSCSVSSVIQPTRCFSS